MNKFFVYDALHYALRTSLAQMRLIWFVFFEFLGGLLIILLPILVISIPYFFNFQQLFYFGTPTKELFIIVGSTIFLVALWVIWISTSMSKIALDVHDTGESSLRPTIEIFGFFPKVAVSFFLFIIGLIISIILFIIPGIIWLVRFQYFLFFIVDQNAGIIESLKLSLKITKGYTWYLFGALIINMTIFAIGHLILFGWVIAWAITMLINVFIYRTLLAEQQEVLEEK